MNTTVEPRKDTKRPGRTLLVSESDTASDYTTLTGLVAEVKTNKNSTFLEFETVEQAEVAYNNLREHHRRVKYCYYKLFMKFSTDISELSYDDIKATVKNVVPGHVLYFKLYKKNGKLIGSGDFTVDKLVDFTALHKKSFETSTNDLQVNFDVYRYRMVKKPVQQD